MFPPPTWNFIRTTDTIYIGWRYFFGLPTVAPPPVPVRAAAGSSAGSCRSRMLCPHVSTSPGGGAVGHGDISPPLPANALNGVLVPIHFPSSEATASSSPSRPLLPILSPLSASLTPSTQQDIYPRSPASLLALCRQLRVLNVFPLVGCCHALIPKDGEFGHVNCSLHSRPHDKFRPERS